MTKKDIVEKLVATGKWSEETARLGIEADFKCEYCGMDLLYSVNNYKLWQVDHIIPTSENGPDIESNKAISCRQCNVNFKSRWDPNKVVNNSLDRDGLITAAKEYIKQRREISEKDLEEVRKIVKYPK